MPGLNLRGGAGLGASWNQPPVVPAAAGSPTGPRGGSSTNAAFGITAGAPPAGSRTPMIGTTTSAVAAALLLMWLWYSLPR